MVREILAREGADVKNALQKSEKGAIFRQPELLQTNKALSLDLELTVRCTMGLQEKKAEKR
jgi:hypothetical protein